MLVFSWPWGAPGSVIHLQASPETAARIKYAFDHNNMQVISFVNMKGGVGKTTLAVNVAYGLAYLHRKKVLIVDSDPQFNATQYLLQDDVYLGHINDPTKGTLKDVFLPSRPGPVNTITGTSRF